MKHIMIFLIKIYQSLPLSSHKNCKYIPTCSEYSKEAYERFGFFYGTYLTIKRISKCVPWKHDSIYDPVPLRRKNEKEN